MVQDRAVARLDRDRAEPGVFLERVVDAHVLVLDEAFGGDVEGGQFDDHVGLAEIDRPFGRFRRVFLEGVAARAAWGASLEPVDQLLGLVGRQGLVVLERADVRIGEVGRHAFGADRLADHRRHGLHDLEAVHREGGDAALLVAGDALGLEDRRDLVRVGDGGVLSRLAAISELDLRARFHLDARLGDGLAGDDGVERLRRFGDGAVIGDLELRFRIDHEDFAFALDAERSANELEFVDEDGDVEALGFRFGGGRVARVLRVQHVEEDALGLVLGLKLFEFGSGFPGNRRAVDLAHKHDCLGVLEIVQLVREAGVVGELEVVGALRDRGCHGRRGDGRDAKCGGAENGGSHGRGEQGAFHVCLFPEAEARGAV